MNKPPVFCRYCKFYDKDIVGCIHPEVVAKSDSDPIRPNWYGSVYKQNRNNDCEFYDEPWLLKRILKLFSLIGLCVALIVLVAGCATDRASFEPADDRIQPLQAQLAIEHAQGLARCYWQQKLAAHFNNTLPVVILCGDEDDLIARVNAEKLPWQKVVSKKIGKEAWAFTNPETGRVYLRDAAGYDTLLHEAGHWYLKLNCKDADAFAEWALKQRLKKFPVLNK